MRNKVSSPSCLKGIKKSMEIKDAQSKAKDKYKKQVLCITTNEIFSCVHEAAKKFPDSFYSAKAAIRKICSGYKSCKSYKGYKFKYV